MQNSFVLSYIIILIQIFDSEKFTAKEESIILITSVYHEKVSRAVIFAYSYFKEVSIVNLGLFNLTSFMNDLLAA